MKIFVYKELTRNQEIGNTPMSILSNIVYTRKKKYLEQNREISKFGQRKKSLISSFMSFLTAIAKFSLWKGNWALGYVTT